VFGEAMMAKAQADIAAILGGYDFGAFATIADIGGPLQRAMASTKIAGTEMPEPSQ